MDALPSIIPKSIVEALYRLKAMWTMRRCAESGFSCKLRAKTPNNHKDSDCKTSSDEEEISALARSRQLAVSFYTRALIASVPGFSDSANTLCVLKVTGCTYST